MDDEWWKEELDCTIGIPFSSSLISVSSLSTSVGDPSQIPRQSEIKTQVLKLIKMTFKENIDIIPVIVVEKLFRNWCSYSLSCVCSRCLCCSHASTRRANICRLTPHACQPTLCSQRLRLAAAARRNTYTAHIQQRHTGWAQLKIHI